MLRASLLSSWTLTMIGALLGTRLAHGQAAVAINIMPPGGEGAASVALGVALPGGPGSMEVNPALLAWEGERTQSVVQYSTSQTDHKAILRDSAGNAFRGGPSVSVETVRSLGLRYPLKPGTDLALGYSWHKFDRGQRPALDEMGDTVSLFPSWDEVHRMVLAGRIGDFASMGLGWRWFDSRLIAGWKDSSGKEVGPATASSWDLGLRLAPTWRVPATPLRLTPSLGMSWITLGEDSVSFQRDEPGTFEPMERVRRWGVALTATVPDLITGEVFLDEENNLTWSDRRRSLSYEGWSVEALGMVRWSSADNSHSEGGHIRTQESIQYIIDAKNLWRLYTRLRTGKVLSPELVDMEAYPLPAWSVLGISFAPNVRFTWTHSEITSAPAGWIDKKEDRLGWAISL